MAISDKNKRLKIYRHLLFLLIENRENAIYCDIYLEGLCFLLSTIWWKFPDVSTDIKDYPELMSIKPKNIPKYRYWWSRKATSMTRINKLKEIIKKMECE